MTKEEAIICLQGLLDNPLINKGSYLAQALEMAIKALENHDTFMKYAYSYGKADALSQEPTVTSTDEPMTMVYPTIVCNDAISREAMLDKIRAEIEYEADYQDAYVNADIAKGMYLALEIFDKYKEGDNK